MQLPPLGESQIQVVDEYHQNHHDSPKDIERRQPVKPHHRTGTIAKASRKHPRNHYCRGKLRNSPQKARREKVVVPFGRAAQNKALDYLQQHAGNIIGGNGTHHNQ